MQLRVKLVLLSTLPILVALASMAVMVRHQALDLAHEERRLVESAYLQSKETELRHYVELARSAIQRVAASGEGDDASRRQQALAMVSRMHFGNDGYFFVYDSQGSLLADARQMALPGVDLCDPVEPSGEMPAKLIVNTARDGGGLVRYRWQKPSSQQTVPKLGYVLPVAGWGWTIGTGLYLDDVETALRHIDERAQANIAATQRRIYAIAALCIVLVGLGGLLLNIQDHRIASAKLRGLARRVVHSQEEERVRVARELHDGVVQVLVSSKFMLETAQLQMAEAAPAPGPAPRQLLDRGLDRLNHALLEIRRVSHGLRPALLDDLGPAAALALMGEQMHHEGVFAVRFSLRGEPRPLPTTHGTALFRVAQEAIQNARTHAGASQAEITLHFQPHCVVLEVQDDGKGFDVQRVQADGQGGIGLRNMRERIEGLAGRFAITSGRRGTRIRAVLDTRRPAECDDAPFNEFPSSRVPA
mgnify:CR=1 FL=1